MIWIKNAYFDLELIWFSPIFETNRIQKPLDGDVKRFIFELWAVLDLSQCALSAHTLAIPADWRRGEPPSPCFSQKIMIGGNMSRMNDLNRVIILVVDIIMYRWRYLL